MWCEVYNIGGIATLTCKNAITDKIPACVECNTLGLTAYPDPVPDCGCGRAGSHTSRCDHRNSFFDPFREPTPEEKQYIANRLSGMGPVKALELSGLPVTVNPDLKAKRLEDKDHIKKYMASVLDANGATDEKIAKVIDDGLDAAEIRVRTVGKNNDGSPKVQEYSRPDWAARARFVEIALRAKGHLDKAAGDVVPRSITIINKLSQNAAPSNDDVIDVEVSGK